MLDRQGKGKGLVEGVGMGVGRNACQSCFQTNLVTLNSYRLLIALKKVPYPS